MQPHEHKPCPKCKNGIWTGTNIAGELASYPCPNCNSTGFIPLDKPTPSSFSEVAQPTPREEFAQSLEDRLEAFRKACINKQPGNGFEVTKYEILAAYDRAEEKVWRELAEQLKRIVPHRRSGELPEAYVLRISNLVKPLFEAASAVLPPPVSFKDYVTVLHQVAEDLATERVREFAERLKAKLPDPDDDAQFSQNGDGGWHTPTYQLAVADFLRDIDIELAALKSPKEDTK